MNVSKQIQLTILFLLFLFLAPYSSKSQSTEDVFTSNTVIWFGLDFSSAKMIGPEGFTNPEEIVNRFFRSWNNLILNEQNKYDIKSFFRKNNVIYDLKVVTKRNSKVNPDELVIESWESHEITKDEIQEIINEYDSDKSGLGLVFIIESFNKIEDIGTMHVTFFDIESSEVLLSRKKQGESGGFGLRNYWARSYYNVMLECEEKYEEWEHLRGEK